jgi:hypothetical protein
LGDLVSRGAYLSAEEPSLHNCMSIKCRM